MSRRNSTAHGHRLYGKETRDSRQPKYRNDSDSEQDKVDYRRIRVLQKNLVYVIGITDDIATTEILESDEYFSRYGRVLKTIINRNAIGQGKLQRYTSYVTFESELDASLAIVAMDEYILAERALKISYGTTKYCSYFLKKNDCPNIKDCYFLHQWDIDNQIAVDDNSKLAFGKQLKQAMKKVADSIEDVLALHRRNRKNNVRDSLFPSIESAVERLFENGFITEQQLREFYVDEDTEEQDKEKSEPSSPPELEDSVLENNSSKCNSIQTTCSPIKPDPSSPTPETQNSCSLEQQQPCVENMIHKYIKRQIMKQSRMSQSRFGFADTTQATTEELDNIRKYIDVYIGPKQH